METDIIAERELVAESPKRAVFPWLSVLGDLIR